MLPAVIVYGLLLGSPALAEEVEITDKARAHFSAGVNYLQDPDGARYEEAYREFRAAYAESPSWKILGNLGITAMKLERDGEAVEAFEKYLAEGGDEIDPPERAQVERDLQTLKASLVTLTLETVPPGATIVDERIPNVGNRVLNRYGPLDGPATLGVRPGHHRITAQLSGHDPAVWEVDVSPGSTAAHTFELEAVSSGAAVPATAGDEAVAMERPIPVPVYIGLAATGALAAGAGITGVLALSKRSDFDDANDGTDPGQARSLRDSGQRLNLVADVLLGGAVAAGAVTAVLYFTRPEVPAPRDTAWRVTPLVGPGTGAVSVTGSF